MTRLVADTNIYISAILFGGLPGQIVDLALSGALTLIASTAILEELEDKLRHKFSLGEEQLLSLFRMLRLHVEVVEPTLTLDAIRKDPSDNRILECAVTAGADAIVSGDRHLLELGTYQGIAILSARQFLERDVP